MDQAGWLKQLETRSIQNCIGKRAMRRTPILIDENLETRSAQNWVEKYGKKAEMFRSRDWD
jgi:hypothetical protein